MIEVLGFLGDSRISPHFSIVKKNKQIEFTRQINSKKYGALRVKQLLLTFCIIKSPVDVEWRENHYTVKSGYWFHSFVKQKLNQ